MVMVIGVPTNFLQTYQSSVLTSRPTRNVSAWAAVVPSIVGAPPSVLPVVPAITMDRHTTDALASGL